MPDIGNTSVFSQTDASNNGATMPGWNGSAAPSTLDDAGRAIQGAITRDWNWRNYTVTSTGAANAYVLTYTVAPAAYYTGSRFAFITNFGVTGTATVNVNTLGAKTIKKDVAGVLTALSSGDIAAGQYIDLVYNGTDMIWVNWQGAASATFTGGALTATTSMTSKPFNEAKGAAVASAATADIWTPADGNFIHITGVTTITSLGTAPQAGAERTVIFDGILTLTHNATTLILPGGANITTAANDRMIVRADTTANMIVVDYVKASGLPIVVQGGFTARPLVVKTAGVTYTTPAGCTQISVEVIGGGGTGGSGSAGGGGSGGGGGGYAKKLYTVTPSTGYTYAVGAAGASSTFTDGTTLITGSGGSVGGAATATGVQGGIGGTGTNGDINLSGGKGATGQGLVTDGLGGQGGSSGMGYGQGGTSGTEGSSGSAGAIYGGGGGGGNGAATSGGAGAAGAVIITEYY